MFAIILAITILSIILVLGGVVLKNNYKSLTNKSFFVLSVFLVLWSIANYLENENISDFLRFVFLKLDFFLGLFVGVAWLFFCIIFLEDITAYKQIKYRFLAWLPLVIFAPLVFSDYIIREVTITPRGINFNFGVLFIPYALSIVTYLFGGLYILLKKYKKFFGLKRNQTLYVLLGLSISATLTLVINLGLQNYIPVDIARLGIYGYIFIIGFTSYAILKYRLMDVRVIIRRSAVFTAIVLLITTIYAVLAFILSLIFTDIFGVSSLILNGVVMAILVALGFEPLKKWLSEATDSFLFKAEYKPQEVLSEVSERLSSTLDLQTLNQFVVDKTHAVFKCTRVSLFDLDRDDMQYKEAARAGEENKNSISKIDKNLFSTVFNYFHTLNLEKEIIVREEIRKTNEQLRNKVLDQLVAEMDKYEVNLIVPIYVKDELISILFYGDKKSGDVYSNEDIRMLQIIASQSGVAMQNARLYQEQKNFAVKLEEEVDKATKELKSANAQLKKLDVAKSEFISIASHQLRTPLTVIKGYLSMIQQQDFGEVPEKIQDPLEKVTKSTARIIGLVEDLLNVSRIESGRMKYDFEMVDPNALATEVFEELEQHAKNKGLKFTYIKPAKKIPELKLDRNKVREVFMNLMDNAIKYTEKGFVTVALEKLDDHVRFSVTDSGRGLSADEIPQLFQKFSRAKGVQLMHTEGTGLGLYIAKKIMLKHHAKIWVESPGAGKGSSFIIEFKVSKE